MLDPRRRPATHGSRGVVAFRAFLLPGLLTGLLLGPLSGCGSEAVEIHAPSGAADDPACQSLVKALPDTIVDQLRRPVTPDVGAGAAWGDPAIVLTCGVGTPAGFDQFSPCLEVDGVGWFLPETRADGADAVATTLGREPTIEVRVPASYGDTAAAGAMAELAGVVKQHLRLVKACS